MQEVMVYVTAMQAVRRTADNCRRILALLDAFGVAVNVMYVDSSELRDFVQELLGKQDTIGGTFHMDAHNAIPVAGGAALATITTTTTTTTTAAAAVLPHTGDSNTMNGKKDDHSDESNTNSDNTSDDDDE
ncbi:hypothetical protein LSM04_006254 [Trypanosoma melophagium]|uniref:uncharacterized protein n=1 Tax=Trypanosoma melophagium TaxID=715481 RepID=UPI003519EDF6|nr:hypothetical protein LSM04_006254 [Trypanosoma melophagium]